MIIEELRLAKEMAFVTIQRLQDDKTELHSSIQVSSSPLITYLSVLAK